MPTLFAYKVFRASTVAPESFEYPCGHPGCTKHRRSPAPAAILRGMTTQDTSLQKASDTQSIPAHLPLKICTRGWHATSLNCLPTWVGWDSWRKGRNILWRVKLSGNIINEDQKLCARTIEMVREIPYYSTEGRTIRAKLKARHNAIEARRKARAAADLARWRAQKKADLLKNKIVQQKQRRILKALRTFDTTARRARIALIQQINK